MQKSILTSYSVGDSLNLKELRERCFQYETKRVNAYTLAVFISDLQYLYIFQFGAVVFFDVPEETQIEFLNMLGLTNEKKASLLSEDFVEDDCVIEYAENSLTVHFNRIVLPSRDSSLIFIAARVLAQSCRLEVIEQEVEGVLGQSERLTQQLQNKEWRRAKRHDITQSLGSILLMRHDMISRLRLLHAPESAWQNEHCDLLYRNLCSHYELESRRNDLEKMLAVASEAAELQLGMLDTRRGEFLEIIIILLIVIEVFQTLLEALK